MDYAKTLLLLVLLIWGLLFYAASRETPQAHSGVHPTNVGMSVGGERAAADRDLVVPGALFAVAAVAFFVVCFCIGADARRQADIKPFIYGAAVPILLVFIAIFATYQRDADRGSSELLGAFPTPTAFVIYGVWLVPTIYCAIYWWGYQRWFAIQLPAADKKTSQG